MSSELDYKIQILILILENGQAEFFSRKVQNFYSSFAEENSFNPQLGQIFSYDEMWLENIINNSEITNILKTIYCTVNI